jgi:hypothetical protein
MLSQFRKKRTCLILQRELRFMPLQFRPVPVGNDEMKVKVRRCAVWFGRWNYPPSAYDRFTYVNSYADILAHLTEKRRKLLVKLGSRLINDHQTSQSGLGPLPYSRVGRSVVYHVKPH